MSNPLLSRIQVPGQSFVLPSRGLFYGAGVLDEAAKDGVVHVHPLTSYDEIVMRNADNLISGSAMYDVIRRRVPSILIPEQLFAKDMDFLFVCLRSVTYGNQMEIPFRHNCKEKPPEHKYEVELLELIRDTVRLDPTTASEVYKVTLPNGQVVSLHPVTFRDSLEFDSAMMKAIDDDSFDEEVLADLTLRHLSLSISQVDEVTDPALIYEWMQGISAGWRKLITDEIEKISGWGVRLKLETECKECGEHIDVDVWTHPANFFM